MRLLIVLFVIATSCNPQNHTQYKNDLNLLNKNTELVELRNHNNQSRVLVSPKFQGRVLTSTNSGLNGISFGWINRDKIKNGQHSKGGKSGGEDRLWIGPLGGQYSFYYQQISPLNEGNWKVPETFNNQPYTLTHSSYSQVMMEKTMLLSNFTGTKFNVKVQRQIRLIESQEIENNLKIKIDDKLKYVAYESLNKLINSGPEKWDKNKGLASIWSAGMFEGTDKTVVIIPLQKKANLNDLYKYLGPLDSTRLKMTNNAVIYKTDGKYRSKIGIPHEFAPEIYASYRPEINTLTIVQFKKTNDSLYFNSEVSIQENPYKGEVIPIYNNGKMDYSPLKESSFFELESVSAMKELEIGDTLTHYHRIYHFTGKKTDLYSLARKLLNLKLSVCKF